MEIRLASITVDDQEKALRFYVDKLGFVKDKDIPMGAFRWLTVSAPEGAAGVVSAGAAGLSARGHLPARTVRSGDSRNGIYHPRHTRRIRAAQGTGRDFSR